MSRLRSIPGQLSAAVRQAHTAVSHPIGRNAVALGSIQIATFLLPLVAIPYLSRVLGPSAFGTLVLAQSMSFMLLVIVDYGFSTWGAREAATVRNDPQALNLLMRDIMSAKMLLALVAALVTIVATFALPVVREDPVLALLAWTAALAQGITPMWLLIGLEHVRGIAVLQLGTRAVIVALTFVVVRDDGAVRLAMGLFTLASVLPAIVTIAMAGRHVDYLRPQLRRAVRPIRDAWHLFVGVGAFSLYTTANVTLLGFFATPAQVGNFGAAERVIRAGVQLMMPLATAALPRLAFLIAEGRRERALRLLGLLALVIGTIGGIGTAIVMIFAEPITSVIYGSEYPQAAEVLRILGPILLLVSISNCCGAGWMLANKLDRQVVRVAIAAAIVNVVLAALLAPAHGPTGMAFATLTAEVVVLAGCIVSIYRFERSVSPTVVS